MAESTSEDVRVGYQVASAAWTYEGSTIWAKFNAFLVANTLTLAASGFSEYGLPRWALGILGLVLCGVWYLIITRSFQNYTYWIMCMREFEGRMGDAVKTLERGARYADGEEVGFDLPKGELRIRMTQSGASVRVQTACRILIAAFALLYVALIGAAAVQ